MAGRNEGAWFLQPCDEMNNLLAVDGAYAGIEGPKENRKRARALHWGGQGQVSAGTMTLA